MVLKVVVHIHMMDVVEVVVLDIRMMVVVQRIVVVGMALGMAFVAFLALVRHLVLVVLLQLELHQLVVVVFEQLF